jgi:hypothetical protein
MTEQSKLTGIVCARPQQFAWFLGAGASAAAGLPTAGDIIWDLKRRYYRREENQDISRQDMQLEAVRARVQSYMLSKGFPDEGTPDEYTTYFEKAFGDDKEKQRQYLAAILSEKNVTLSIGNRILGALLASAVTRGVFTTNFDTVVERAVAAMSGQSLAAFHLEGAASANKAISNEEYPVYCKLHGDFRYESIKNLPADLASQNEDLSRALVNAANRFGFIVAGYSGRDESVIQLLRSTLTTPNPFPHGLFWTGMKGSKVLPAVTGLLEDAKQAGVDAAFVEIETFDAFMLRLWRNLDNKDPALDAKIRKSAQPKVNIPLPKAGQGAIVRMNAVPIFNLPELCQSLSFRNPKEWMDLRAATGATEGRLIFTKGESVLCWGAEALIRDQFKDLVSISPHDLSRQIADIGNHLYVKGFLEEAICRALSRGRPLLTRTTKSGSHLIADPHSTDQSPFSRLQDVVGKTSGQIPGLFTSVDEDHPHPEKVHWAEAVRISIGMIDGRNWLLLDPDVWIWPPRARKDATDFLDKRRGNRYNNIYNTLLDAWLTVLLGRDRAAESKLSAFDAGSPAETPSFNIGSRTAYTRGSHDGRP